MDTLRKGFAHFLIVVVITILGIGAVGYYAFKNGQIKTVQKENTLNISPTPIVSMSAKEGWLSYSNWALGFSLNYPVNWSILDTSKLRYYKLYCFGPNAGDLVNNRPAFCVDLDYWANTNEGGFASNTEDVQQGFYEELNKRETNKEWLGGNSLFKITRKFNIDGLPAIERIETNKPGLEGAESYYQTSVYVNSPTLGLVRLSMTTWTKEEFEQNKSTYDEILSTFKFLN